MQFAYQARDASGRIRDGELVANTADEATAQLRADGLYLMSLVAREAKSKVTGPSLFQKRVHRQDIIYFTNQLAVMIDAGVPMADALNGLARQCENPTFKSALSEISRQVEGGEDLSAALNRYPKYFDRTYVNLVKASEASGTLGTMLDRISVQSRSELETRQQVRGALLYPAGMLVMCIGVCIFLLAYVFPKLMPMFASKQMDVPTPTKIMIFTSGILTDHWYWVVAAVLAVIGFLLYARQQSWGRIAFDWFWLNVPVLGPMMRKVAISRSMRTLATTINAGVPMLDALELSAGVANNVHYENCWLEVSRQVTSGKQVCEALEGNKLFPSTLVQMISSGEATGKLGQVLNKVSDYFDREVANAVKTATSMIEPVMVGVMGGVIGTIALAMLLPIFKLSTGQG